MACADASSPWLARESHDPPFRSARQAVPRPPRWDIRMQGGRCGRTSARGRRQSAMAATEARAVNCPQWAARGARGVVKWRARAAGWYGLMPAAPLLGRVSAPRTAHRERIGAIEHGGNRRGCEAPLCVPFLLLVYGASGDRRAVMSDLLKLLLHDTVNSNPLDFAAPTVTDTVSVTVSLSLTRPKSEHVRW